MKKQHFLLALLLLNLIIYNSVFAQENAENNFSFPEFEGLYMGQKPPGLIAKPFAPGIISTEGWEVEGVFAPGMKEFYFTTSLDTPFRATIIGFRQENNVWKKFTEFKRNGETAFSPDGNRMYTAEGYRDREGGGWSERKSLGSMFEREDWGIMRLTASTKGTYVFDDYKSSDVIRISKVVDGKRQEPVEMGPVVNTGKWTAHPFIAPDESYLIWDSEREEGFGDSDLYISFKQEDGSWGTAINMGENINTDKWEAFGSVTSDGKYLLFNRGIDDDNVDIFWVDAQIIEKLRIESNFPPLEERYLGQKPPSLTPKVFAPNLVSTEENVESLFVFTPDMKKFYFSRHEGEFKKFTSHIVEYKNQKWSQASELPENIRKYREHYDPNYEKFKNLEPFKDFRGFSVSSKGTCFFYDIERDGSGDMYYSRLINGEYESPQKMSEEINAGLYKAHPFISPDESYLLWDAEKEGEHGADIYISFKQQDGSWGAPINMGEKINTGGYEQHARLTPDGKYLFFWRGDEQLREDGSTFWKGSPHWVDAKIIETLRPKTTAHTIAFGSNGICLTDMEGSSKVRLTYGDHGYPAWSPDGKQIAFYGYYDGKKTWSIHTVNSDGSNLKRLTHVKNKWDNMPAWSPDGKKLVFAREYEGEDKVWQHELWTINPDGSEEKQIKALRGGGPSFLPDGRLLFHSEYKDKESEISISDIDGKNIIHLTDNEAEEWDAKVSPDGKQIAFTSNRDGNHEIYIMNLDGSNQQRLTNNDVDDYGPTWSPDGSQIVFQSKVKEGKPTNLYIMNKDGSSIKKIISGGWQPAWFNVNSSTFPILEDRYFGEESPSLTPKLFAPEILSPDGCFEGGSYSHDMKEYYFTRKNGKYKERTFFVIRYENGKWGNESETNLRWPKFSPDGNTMFIGKKYRERTKTGWSEPKNLGEFLKEQAHGKAVSSNQTFYFPIYKNGHGYLNYSRLINGKHENPVKMSDEINTGKDIAHPYIASDESYLMWDVEREDGKGGSDIYISFRQKDGSWLTPINMGSQINTELQESSPKVTRDGKYLFFSRGEWKEKEDGSTYWVGKPYWVDAKIIETLRPKSISYEIAYSSTETGYGEVYLTDSQGKSKIKITNNDGNNGYPAWSPDGKQIAFYGKYDDKKTWSIHTMNSDGSNQKRLTHEKNTWDSAPTWSPDGEKIAFWRTYKPANGNRKHEIWLMDADGSNQHQLGNISGGAPHFLPDGRIVFHSETDAETSEICIANIDGSNIVQLTNYNAQSWHPEVSPDGKRIAYMSNKDGNQEIYVMDSDGQNQTRLTINNVRDSTPSWSSDGSQIIFVSRDEEDKMHVYIMNADGSSMRKFINNGGQPAWFKSYK